MMYMVDRSNFGQFAREIMEMHQLRYRVFKERLNWDVMVSGDMEIDEYDALNPVYLLRCNDSGKVDGCVRFLPTTGPNMLRNTFPALLGPNSAPESPLIWESSRFSLDIDVAWEKTETGVSRATCELIAGMYEFAISRSVKHILTVTDVCMERILRRIGVPWWRIHRPQRIGNSIAVAGLAEVSQEVLNHLCTLGGLRRPVLAAPMRLKETA